MILAASSISHAEEFNMDFDKGAFRSADFMEAVKTFDVSKAENTANMKPAPVAALSAINTVVYKLTAPGLQKLRGEISQIPGLSEEFLQLVNHERTIVLHNDQGVFLTTLAGKDNYYTLLESNNKKLIEFLSKQKTEVMQAELHNKNWVKVCLPVVKTLWKWIQGIWTAYEVTEYLCHQEWEGDPLPPTGNGGGGGGALPYLPINPPVQK